MTYGHYNWSLAAGLKAALLQSTPQSTINNHAAGVGGGGPGTLKKAAARSSRISVRGKDSAREQAQPPLTGPKLGLFLASTPDNPVPDVLRPSSALPLADMSLLQLTVALHHLVGEGLGYIWVVAFGWLWVGLWLWLLVRYLVVVASSRRTELTCGCCISQKQRAKQGKHAQCTHADAHGHTMRTLVHAGPGSAGDRPRPGLARAALHPDGSHRGRVSGK